MSEIITVGLDLAKTVFVAFGASSIQVHGADTGGVLLHVMTTRRATTRWRPLKSIPPRAPRHPYDRLSDQSPRGNRTVCDSASGRVIHLRWVASAGNQRNVLPLIPRRGLKSVCMRSRGGRSGLASAAEAARLSWLMGVSMNQTDELIRTEIAALIRDTARLRQRPVWQPVLAGIPIALLGLAAGAFLTWLS